MKVTVRFDEAAAMTPSEVKVRQAEAEKVREYSRKWAQCSRVYVVATEDRMNFNNALRSGLEAIGGGK